MADFVDSEAEESEEENSDEELRVKAHKLKKQMVDSDEEEEDDDEGEVNDLIDDNPIEEDSDNESDRSGRKRKRSDDEDDFEDRLEDDDYELLEENLGIKVQRKYKRITRPQDADSDDEDATRDTEHERDAVRSQMEGSDNEDERGHQRDDAPRQYASDESEGEYSETDDFIVDDKGRPLAEKRKKRKPIFADSTLQEAQDIFGVDFDYDDFEKYEDDYYEDEEDEDEDQYEDEEQRNERASKKVTRKRRKPKSIYEIYEPSELERAGFTDDDNRIRTQDIPERMQLRSVPVTPAEDEELDEEAEWIYECAFSKLVEKQYGSNTHQFERPMIPRPEPSIAPSLNLPRAPESTFDDFDRKSIRLAPPPQSTTGWNDEWVTNTVVTTHIDTDISSHLNLLPMNRTAEEKKAKYIKKIKKALEFMRNLQLEVPFIAFYRKEYIDPELSCQDLWTVYRLDAKFCQLRSRKLRLITLFKNMQEYQQDLILSRPDEPIPDSVRVINDDDIEQAKSIKSHEELKDVYSQFSLYYSQDVEAMKAALKAKKRKEKQLAREMQPRDGEEEGTQKEDDEDDKMDEDDDKTPQIKRKVGSGSYGLCRKFGIDGLAKKFGLLPEKFAKNLRDNYQRYEVDQEPLCLRRLP